jgi:hypothetical protein
MRLGFLIASGVALLLVLVALQRCVASQTAPIEVGAPAPSVREPAQVAADSSPTPPRRAPKIPQGSDSPPELPEPAPEPSLEPRAEPGSPENITNLHYGSAAFREQIAAVEPLLGDCIQRVVDTGRRPNGVATLTFIVGMQGSQAVVEQTAIDHDNTTLDDSAGLLGCMRETARAMRFDGLPREASAVVVTRRVRVEDGILAENQYVGFSYLR